MVQNIKNKLLLLPIDGFLNINKFKYLPEIFIGVNCFAAKQTTFISAKWSFSKNIQTRTNYVWYLRSAEPNWAADPIPNSPRISASNLLRSAIAGNPELDTITATANAPDKNLFHVFGSPPEQQSSLFKQQSNAISFLKKSKLCENREPQRLCLSLT